MGFLELGDFVMRASEFKPIVAAMPKEFTSHIFIKAYIRENEAEYISQLKPKRGGFRDLNSKIARTLERNHKYLMIQKEEDKVPDENIKGYISKNAVWTRIDI